MSVFGFYFVASLLREAGWPREQGLFKGEGYDTVIVDATIDQMIDWAAALGAGRPRLALHVIGELFRDRDWAGVDAPQLKTILEHAQTTWNNSANLAPHEVVEPSVRLATTVGKSISVKDFQHARLRVILEQHFRDALLWGLSNPDRFATWYVSCAQHHESSLPFMRKADPAADALPPLAQFFKDSEQVIRTYELEVGALPPIPPKLMSDATALGWQS